MERKMFCFQCQQTAGCVGCMGNAGVCGKRADTADLQDKLPGALIALAQANAGKVILVNLPPIDEKSYFERITRKGESRENILYFLHDDIGRIYRDQEMYSERIGKLAAESGCKLIDIRCSFLQCGDYRPLLCRDGIHPNSAGHHNIIRTFGEELAAS